MAMAVAMAVATVAHTHVFPNRGACFPIAIRGARFPIDRPMWAIGIMSCGENDSFWSLRLVDARSPLPTMVRLMASLIASLLAPLIAPLIASDCVSLMASDGV